MISIFSFVSFHCECYSVYIIDTISSCCIHFDWAVWMVQRWASLHICDLGDYWLCLTHLFIKQVNYPQLVTESAKRDLIATIQTAFFLIFHMGPPLYKLSNLATRSCCYIFIFFWYYIVFLFLGKAYYIVKPLHHRTQKVFGSSGFYDLTHRINNGEVNWINNGEVN